MSVYTGFHLNPLFFLTIIENDTGTFIDLSIRFST